MNENKDLGLIVTLTHKYDQVVKEANAVPECTKEEISDLNCGRYRCDFIWHTAQLPLLAFNKLGRVQIWDAGINKRKEALLQENKSPSKVHRKKGGKLRESEDKNRQKQDKEKPALTKAKSNTLAMKKSGLDLGRTLWHASQEKLPSNSSTRKNKTFLAGKHSSEQKAPQTGIEMQPDEFVKKLYGVLAYHSRIMHSVTQQIP